MRDGDELTSRRTGRGGADQLVADVGIREATKRLGVAALVFTYRCSIACRHCLFGCSAGRPDVVMTVDQAVRALEMLHDLGRVVHVAGGEAMCYWQRLQDVLAAACERGCQPHFIETNCSFAVSDEIVRRRLEFIRDCGVAGMFYSADPFHQEHVPAAFVDRVGRVTREIFGEANAFGHPGPLEAIEAFAEIARDERRLRQYAAENPLMLVGEAYRNFADLYEDHPLDDLPGMTWGWKPPDAKAGCRSHFDLDDIWEVHVDPYDNIQTNCGVILGDARKTTPREVLDRSRPHGDPLVEILIREGPVGLAAYARDRHGYTVPATAKTRCSLCYEVRRFLRPHHPETFGPAELYDQ